MDRDGIKTSHDLADLLEDTVRILRMLPAMQLADARPSGSMKRADSPKHGTGDQEHVEDGLALLAGQISVLDRSGAQTELTPMTVDSLRQLAFLLDIRIPSKATKAESIDLLLSQLFDAPAGHELIRTYHKRTERTPQKQPFVSSATERRQ